MIQISMSAISHVYLWRRRRGVAVQCSSCSQREQERSAGIGGTGQSPPVDWITPLGRKSLGLDLDDPLDGQRGSRTDHMGVWKPIERSRTDGNFWTCREIAAAGMHSPQAGHGWAAGGGGRAGGKSSC